MARCGATWSGISRNTLVAAVQQAHRIALKSPHHNAIANSHRGKMRLLVASSLLSTNKQIEWLQIQIRELSKCEVKCRRVHLKYRKIKITTNDFDVAKHVQSFEFSKDSSKVYGTSATSFSLSLRYSSLSRGSFAFSLKRRDRTPCVKPAVCIATSKCVRLNRYLRKHVWIVARKNGPVNGSSVAKPE